LDGWNADSKWGKGGLQYPVVVARIRAKIRRIRLSELPGLDILIRSEPTGMRACNCDPHSDKTA
jgi:hypothetical protein